MQHHEEGDNGRDKEGEADACKQECGGVHTVAYGGDAIDDHNGEDSRKEGAGPNA